MTRFLTRENVKLVVVAVAVLLLAWTAPSVAHGVHAQFAHNADKVDGKHAVSSGASLNKAKKKLVAHNKQGQLPDKFVGKPSTITTTHGHSAWVENNGAPPASITRFTNTTRVSGNGFMQIGLQAPQSYGSATYGLAAVQICYDVSTAPGLITATSVEATTATGSANLVADPTDRTSPIHNCYSVSVGKAVPFGASLNVQLSGGGFVDLSGVRATWTRAAGKVAPRTVAPRGLGSSGN